LGNQGRRTIRGAVVAACLALPALLLAASPDEAKRHAFETIERNADQIALLGDSLFYFGELGMQEFESTKLIKETLERAGFAVETGGGGMPSALWATWGTAKPLILIATEVDALPEGSQTPGVIDRKPLVEGAPGHMEGHNTMGAVAVGAAYAVKRTMERDGIQGSVAISLGPAEEQLMSRPYLVRAGQYKGVDAAIIIHIADSFGTGYGLMNYALIGAKFTFIGKSAHGSVNPWDGKDAVDAVVLMDIGFDKLREHLRPTYRAHRAITMGGTQPNIIPDKGQIWWFVRDATGPAAKETYDKLVDIGKGAALMTGTTVEVQPFGAAWPQLGNKAIGEAIQKNVEAVGMPTWSEEEVRFVRALQKSVGAKEVGLNTQVRPFRQGGQTTASNDIGDITWNVPTGVLNFPASAPGVLYHHWKAAVTPTSSFAHKGMVAGAKALAASVLDLMMSPDLLATARAQFADHTRETKYFSLLPADAKPPLDLNREMMEKFRSDMRKFYLNKPVQFR
jgi:aminobenzoyl-glutamate utilization protein B